MEVLRKYLIQYVFGVLSIAVPSVNAAPVIYSLEGIVTGVYGAGPSVDALSFSYGSEVTYKFLIDTERAGYSILSDGSRSYHQDINTERDQVTYFYAELLEISYDVVDSYYNFGRVNYFANNTDSPAFDSKLGRVSVGLELLRWDTSSFIENWELGDIFGGSHQWHDSITEDFITIHTYMTLTNIQSVPIPATAWLFLSSFACLLGFRSAIA